MARSWLAVIALLSWPHVARTEPARFAPPSSVERAQARYLRGKKLFQAKQYAAAAEEFAAAYDLDPEAKFLLFNLGVAHRMAGSCQDAVEAYRAFLDAGPPSQLSDNARIGIERCEKIIALLPPAPPEPAKPEPVQPEPVRSEPVQPEPVQPEPAKLEPAKSEPAPPESGDASPAATPPRAAPSLPIASRPREPWYQDHAGDVLTGSGAACAIASATLYVLARRDADATARPRSLADYEANRTEANQFQIASAITGAAGVALVIFGVVHYATRPTPHQLAIAPIQGGAGLSLGGRF